MKYIFNSYEYYVDKKRGRIILADLYAFFSENLFFFIYVSTLYMYIFEFTERGLKIFCILNVSKNGLRHLRSKYRKRHFRVVYVVRICNVCVYHTFFFGWKIKNERICCLLQRVLLDCALQHESSHALINYYLSFNDSLARKRRLEYISIYSR